MKKRHSGSVQKKELNKWLKTCNNIVIEAVIAPQENQH